MKKAKKVFTSLCATLILSAALSPVAIVYANETTNTSDYGVTQTSNNSVILFDNESGESISVTVIDSSHAIVTDSNGQKSEVFIDNNGNVYVNGYLEVTREDLEIQTIRDESLVEAEKHQPRFAFRSAANKVYRYQRTIYTNTKLQGEAMNIVYGILSFNPYIGPIATLSALVDAFRSYGHDTMYIKVDIYCTDGYQFYRYDSYYYSDPGRTNLVRSNSYYRQMW